MFHSDMKAPSYIAPSVQIIGVASGSLLAASQLEDPNFKNPIPFELGNPSFFDGGFVR